MNNNILQYESIVWATADLLRGAGIKESDFPKFMMPFFALIMVESRLLRMKKELEDELKLEGVELSEEEFIEELEDKGQGYNRYLFTKQKTLKDMCKNDKTFETDFFEYLKEFDAETKDLLGVEKGSEDEKYLDISGMCGVLKKKKILFAYVKEWSDIDLIPFNNSEITTLEEHIKRKWADISAETAGEQYTPDDVITLISEIVASKVQESDRFLTIYDPTCGGGNMLYGVEDRIKEKFERPTATYGMDWNDALYALAKIESRFRVDSHIEHDNTLLSSKFYDKSFDVIVANPPYGVDWKGMQKDIKEDKSGQFHDYPSISDGQLLFLQHIIHKLDSTGIGVVVHNGSTLFSGDAGSGESNIRKWMFDNDYVEAIIQLPTDEFFNTGIHTYLWILNKNKKQPNKVMLINASEKFKLLKKNKGNKRKEVDEDSRIDIVNTLSKFESNDYAKVFKKEYFYYNKQAIQLTNLDYKDRTFEEHLNGKNSIKYDFTKIVQDDIIIKEQIITEFDNDMYFELKEYNEKAIKPLLKELDYKEKDLKVYWGKTDPEMWYFDEEKETLIKEYKDEKIQLGCGKIVIKSSYKKATKTLPERIEISFELTPDYQKDYEIIPYDKDEKENQKNIEEFMSKYIFKPFTYLDNVIGCEINFNKVFYKPQELRPLETILDDISDIDEKLDELEKELGL